MSSLKFRTTLTGLLLERVVSEDIHSRYPSEAALENDLAEQASELGYALGVGETKLIGRQTDLQSSASAGRGLTLVLLLVDRLVAATALCKRTGDSNRFTEVHGSHWGSGLPGSTTASDNAGGTKTYIHLTDSGREAAKAAAERATAQGLTYRDVTRHSGADVPSGDGLANDLDSEMADVTFS